MYMGSCGGIFRGLDSGEVPDWMVKSLCKMKAYDIVPHLWIVEMLKTVKVADNLKGLCKNIEGPQPG